MEINLQTKVGDIVAKNYLTAMIFSKYAIDFCCGGQRTIEKVCTAKNVDYRQLIHDLNNFFAEENPEAQTNHEEWQLDVLANHILAKHHTYIKEKTPILLQYLAKLCKVHGVAHPEILTINQLFTESSQHLATHLQKEEIILFPYILNLIAATQNFADYQSPSFGSIANPIAVMAREHELEGEKFREMRQLSNNYTPPDGACNTYKATFAALEDFERDLHLHIHLESNLLFPKSQQLEQNIVQE